MTDEISAQVIFNSRLPEFLDYLTKCTITVTKKGIYDYIQLKHPDGWGVTYPRIHVPGTI